MALDVREVLADPAQGGAYFVDMRENSSLADAARALDFRVVHVDLAGCADKEEVLRRFARELQFPSWFGGNFDALADSIGDLSWARADGYLLLIEHIDTWRQADDDNFATLLDILNEAAVVWGEQGVPFWSVMLLPPEQLDKLVI
ncbi:barstar family protein [Lysobacter tyrosinilyticus]